MSRLEDGEVLNCSQVPNSHPDHLPVVTDQVRNRKTCQRTKLRKNSGFIVCSEVRFLLIHLKYQCYVFSNQVTGPKPYSQFLVETDLSTGERTETSISTVRQTKHKDQES